ncbi:hypothetical protein F1721_06735 [Saccharopolyspora hirsuta]|uniref:Uncharacterized protein n=1 Tax=Saccharopolyspora hirsuta TaxID=1837 RepID=A0A5M7C0T7_SACHI|nr:hypothetical protein [Saccharopolyspora hirsuta]KAA5836036.1 hypothetical protein F1721_06735 [Saccharopolyspora hirsuta]
MASGDDMDRAIRALRTGAALPAESCGLLADLIEAHVDAEVGTAPPKGWLIADMAALDLARAALDGRSAAPDDLKRIVAALREGMPLQPELSPKLAALLEKHQLLEWPEETSEAWQSVRDGAQAVAAAVVQSMG